MGSQGSEILNLQCFRSYKLPCMVRAAVRAEGKQEGTLFV